jgi:hypothetical protein
MPQGPITNIPMPSDLASELESQASKFGMDLPTFMAFIARVHLRKLDREFTSAVKFLFTKYPNALRKLAQ